MQQRLSVLTLGVDNLPAMEDFYTHILGWHPVASNRDIVFFQLNGFLLSLFERKHLALALNVSLAQSRFCALTLACNVHSMEQVHQLYEKLKGKGVQIIKEPFTPPFGGCMFYFSDIEANIWEVAYNPFIPLDEKGNVITHQNIAHL